MTRPLLLVGAALALSVGFAAQAQPPATQPANPPSATSPPPADASATASMFKAGMVVKDNAGATVGTITQVGRTSDGTAAVAVNVDGKAVALPASALSLSPAGDAAVSSMTKAQIKAASGQPG
jgi:hypothetical protein